MMHPWRVRGDLLLAQAVIQALIQAIRTRGGLAPGKACWLPRRDQACMLAGR